VESGQAPSVIVTSIRGALQLIPREPVACRRVTKGTKLELEEMAAWLVEHGYRREPQVEHRGEFSIRGGIIDIFSASAATPLRIDLFGDEVDRLFSFDPGDQRSRDALLEAVVVPAREFTATAPLRARAHDLANTQDWAKSSLDRLSQGLCFDGMEGFFGLLDEDRITVTSLLGPSASIVLLEPSRLRSRAVELLDEERSLVSSLLETWGAVGIDGEVVGLHADLDQLLATSQAVTIAMPGSPEGPETPQLPTGSIDVVAGDASRLASQITRWRDKNFPVVAAVATARSAERFIDVVAAEGITALSRQVVPADPELSVLVSGLSRGFVLTEQRIAVLAEADITGRRSPHRAPRPRPKVTTGFFDDLGVGSYVVHRQHGIARFSGVTTRTLGETTREYLILEFRGGDRIYLPVDQIEMITPYSAGDAPSLSKMGGADWQRTRTKARSAASEVAEELVALYRQRLMSPGHAFQMDTPWQAEMEAAFPFEETPDQLEAIVAVKADMEAERPMDRLVCADVGFGKTEIAVRAAFKAVQEGKQVAVLVPTTLLASQHHQVFSERFGGYPITVSLLSRFLTDAEAREVRLNMAEGNVDVVVGTHRLLSEDIAFKNLGLLVVDEEQRFGVNHKEAIKAMSAGVDVLTLTASPIPRTLEMALTGIRDLSMVTTPPADRRPILTFVGERDDRAVIEAIRRELLRDGQVFYVHNRVADIDDVARRVRDLVPEARVAIAHGQMDEGSLERVVMDFADRQADVLVCTTIVENGIDMPTVNTLIVDRADLLGLGQLHQLRGRVGRSGQRAYAYLFHPTDMVLSEAAYERLRTIGEATELGSGFKIAMRDLEIRGAGNLLGRDQSGHVTAVGYDLYVQMVAEAVSEARGDVIPEIISVSIDLPGEAHLPESYVTQSDVRIEAYRRLSNATTDEHIADMRDEWLDRFGPLPVQAQGLLDLAGLRVACLRIGIREIGVLPARLGGRAIALAKISPITLKASAQIRVQRLVGDRAYDEESKTLRVDLRPEWASAAGLRDLLDQLGPVD
jgi:transcription-repair coupling factor (superfamily II helicase)